MSHGEKPGFQIVLENAELDDVEKVLKDHFKQYKGKSSGNSKTEVMFDDATIMALSDNTVDVYVKVYQASTSVKINAFFDLGGIYLSGATHSEQAKAAEELMAAAGLRYYKFRTEQELKTEEISLKELEKSLDGLIKVKDRLQKSIASSERDIERSRQDIAENLTDQDRKRAEIETQKDVIIKIADAVGDEKKVAQKTLKGLERDLEKLEKSNEKLHEGIANAETSIDESRREITKNEDEQRELKQKVSDQQLTVRDVEARLAQFPKFK